MDINMEELAKCIKDGLRAAVKDRLGSNYGSPLPKLVDDAVAMHGAEMKALLGDTIKSCLNDDAFRTEIAAALRTSMAKTLVQKFGGELERQVNQLKSDPATRARITVAIDEIIKQKGGA